MDLSSNGQFEKYNPEVLNLRCPACRHVGAFGGIGSSDLISKATKVVDQGAATSTFLRTFGMRVCPNQKCKSVLFFARDHEQQLTFPPETIDFDSTGLPPRILASLEEAIRCHAAQCFRSAALMVRRTLEELCRDKNATGDNLKARIGALQNVAVIPVDLMSAADELRILGNDAAHVEAKAYDQIGQEESALAIDLAKELLKAVYQYASLVDRLRALKKP